MESYKIVRYFQDPNLNRVTVKKHLTLAEAQAHCKDPETSSRTCKKPVNVRRTKTHGPWFDGYTKE